MIPAGTPFLPAVMVPGLSCNNLTIATGAMVQVMGTPIFTINGTLTIMNGGILMNQATVRIKGNFINQNSFAFFPGPGTFEFNGTFGQIIQGQNMFQNLILDNAAGLTIGGSTRINGILTIVNGRVTLGSNNLLLGSSAYVAAWPSASRMVVASGTGELRKEFLGTGSFTYPVGDVTGTAEYSPVTLNFTAGTFAGGNNYAGITVVDARVPGTATSYLTRYWNLSQTGITGFSCNSAFQYVPADVVGTEADIFCTKVDALPWITYNASNTSTHIVDAHGLSSFSTFTGNLGNGAVPPAVRSLQDKTISAGMVSCADATNTLLIAGNGTTYLVQNGGSVSHIAGQNIFYYPGTKVDPGGYLHGYISTVFCAPYSHPAVPTEGSGTGEIEYADNANTLFRIYPNPTPGRFTLELLAVDKQTPVNMVIYGMHGEKVLSGRLGNESRHEFSIAGAPAGMYIVLVYTDDNSATRKIIKTD
ncbi:MAG: T9SS type A sorting domain-containing protein [bacterium]